MAVMWANSAQTRHPRTLTAAERSAVRDLAAEVAAHDGAEALGEATLIGLDRDDVGHLLGAASAGEPLPAYAQVWTDGTAELAVRPGRRREGLGTALWERARAAGARRAWAHGDLPVARAAAAAWGLARVRELRHMHRPLTPDDALPVALPAGYAVRAFVPGQDDAAWLRTNARAFSGHPEQGRVRQEDLDRLMAQDWFDPAGFLVVEATDRPGEVAAYHWTKVAGAAGEVFVVGVDPDHQGHGLAGPVTRLGLAHLARRGLAEVGLYVDGTNERAVRTYERLGFVVDAVDVMYEDVAHDDG